MSLHSLALNVVKVAIKVFKTEVTLIPPDGAPFAAVCQFLSNRTSESPDSGEPMAVFTPIATFHRSSLVRIPENGEIWGMLAPLDPDIPDVKTFLSFDTSKTLEGGRSLGEIRIYFSEVQQS